MTPWPWCTTLGSAAFYQPPRFEHRSHSLFSSLRRKLRFHPRPQSPLIRAEHRRRHHHRFSSTKLRRILPSTVVGTMKAAHDGEVGIMKRMQATALNIPPLDWQKEKVVMGLTGTGKSRVSTDLATRFNADLINAGKKQVYEGLDEIFTNSAPHHLLGTVDDGCDRHLPEQAHQRLLVRNEYLCSESNGCGVPAVVVMGPTGFGKSRVSTDLATRFNAELINSDKIQVYEDIVSHHLLGTIVSHYRLLLRSPRSPRATALNLPPLHPPNFNFCRPWFINAKRTSTDWDIPINVQQDEYFNSESRGWGGPVAERLLKFIKSLWGSITGGGAADTFVRKWNTRSLTYEFHHEFPGAAKPAVTRAFASWGAQGFIFSLSSEGRADIRIGMFKGEHGDLDPFVAGPGGVLAHAFPPPHGEIHFNTDQPWSYDLDPPRGDIKPFYDFQSVAVHEIGHALGIKHINNPEAVMFRSIGTGVIRRGLTPVDVAALEEIYSGDDPMFA